MDAIQAYRLEMGQKLPESIKPARLYDYWGVSISEAICRDMQGDTVKPAILVNVASQE
jgi:cytoplasmic iron level regulating protein YaaA (DUF328/UPF0246 family)